METQDYIPVEIFCQQYSVEVSFISSLQAYGLIEIVQQDEAEFIAVSQLAEAEKIMRLHHDLQINTEGLDVVIHLLQKIESMKREMALLKSKLSIYEELEG
ncbi:MAG: chaperone modulator CbpM [Bacteroidetes bacterium]|nr:chaperone modulator CbpM [Bacteroidota bacterium]